MIPGYGAGELKEQESRKDIVSHIQAQELGRRALGVQCIKEGAQKSWRRKVTQTANTEEVGKGQCKFL